MDVKLLSSNKIASVFGMYNDKGSFEAVISRPKENKIVFVVSTLYGCPVKCLICDASLQYNGKISLNDMIFQLDYLINEISAEKLKLVKKFKIQFSRMGEPAYNSNVNRAIEYILKNYSELNPVLSISSIAPFGTDTFFERLNKITKIYGRKNEFQIQFSIHSTDREQRDYLIPIRKMEFKKVSHIGMEINKNINKKITLNFALFDGVIINTDILLDYFSPDVFILKFTPVNPTSNALKSEISITENSNAWQKYKEILNKCNKVGYEIIESVGDFRENEVKSNCGQYVNG